MVSDRKQACVSMKVIMGSWAAMKSHPIAMCIAVFWLVCNLVQGVSKRNEVQTWKDDCELISQLALYVATILHVFLVRLCVTLL